MAAVSFRECWVSVGDESYRIDHAAHCSLAQDDGRRETPGHNRVAGCNTGVPYAVPLPRTGAARHCYKVGAFRIGPRRVAAGARGVARAGVRVLVRSLLYGGGGSLYFTEYSRRLFSFFITTRNTAIFRKRPRVRGEAASGKND